MNDYCPFGLTFNSYSRENSIAQDYKYNGKEEQNELGLGWLDYGARMYMSDIGRFGVIDILSEKYKALSPYSYVADNPVNYVDIDGREIVNPAKKVLSNRKFIKKLRQFDRALAEIAGVDRSSYKLIITGGDRYKKDGKILSKSDDSEVKNSNPNTFHMQENGALAVDFRESKFTEEQLKKAAKEVGLDYQAGYTDKHWHLEWDSQAAKAEYVNDANIDKSHAPTDYELNNEESNDSREAGNTGDPQQVLWQQIVQSVEDGDLTKAEMLTEIFNQTLEDNEKE